MRGIPPLRALVTAAWAAATALGAPQVITVTAPSAGAYLWYESLLIDWDTKQNDLPLCPTVNVILVDGENAVVVIIRQETLNAKVDELTWVPGNAVNPDTGRPFGSSIDGGPYRIRVECHDTPDVDFDLSPNFDLYGTPFPTPAPTFPPTRQSVPAPSVSPSSNPSTSLAEPSRISIREPELKVVLVSRM